MDRTRLGVDIVIATGLAGFARLAFAVAPWWFACLATIMSVALPIAIARARRASAVAVAALRAQQVGAAMPIDSAVLNRLSPFHPVSRLPVREALLTRIGTDGAGMLGVLALADYERLTAFDPALGDHVLAECTARLRAMLPPSRLAAQIDRGHIGLWFASESDAEARAELEAVAYALGREIQAGGTVITPQTVFRLARYDRDDALDVGAFVNRTLAAFALPAAAPAAPDAPPRDHTELARDHYALEQDLRQAIARQELRLAFQPLIDAGKRQVSGAEALIRWEHPARGAIPPARFVPIVEAMGLANEIGLWALNAAIRAAQGWIAQGLPTMRVAVNISGLQLERDDLAVLVQRTLQRHDVPAHMLEIELTESVATSDAAHCRRIFQTLRAMGVKLAVDDFGTGYSGFSSLRALAFDKIKIDREFVTDVDVRRDSQAICQSIIALGRGLGIRVLAEGIERHGEYAWLRRHGCQHFQGFYFARPMPGEPFAAFVRDRERLHKLLHTQPGLDDIERRLRA